MVERFCRLLNVVEIYSSGVLARRTGMTRQLTIVLFSAPWEVRQGSLALVGDRNIYAIF